MKFILLFSILLFGCDRDGPPKNIVVHKDLCIYQCVKKLLYNIESIDGTGVIKVREVCSLKFKHLTCCKSDSMDYYKACKS